MIKIPAKYTWLLLSSIMLLIAGAYFLTPKQQRLGDDYRKADQLIPPSELSKAKAEELVTKDIQVFYFASGDKTCSQPLPLSFDDLDKRKSFQTITALHALLNHEIPQGYFSAVIPSTTLNNFKVSQGTAYVDMSTFLTLGDGPCSFAARKNQIIKTLSQFGEFKEIVLQVDGKNIE